jgi:hypothetical protein
LSFSFCTFRSDQSQQNVEAIEKQATKSNFEHIRFGIIIFDPTLQNHKYKYSSQPTEKERDENASKGGKTIQVKKLEYLVDVEPRNRLFTIELKQGVSGRKFIGINQVYCHFLKFYLSGNFLEINGRKN